MMQGLGYRYGAGAPMPHAWDRNGSIGLIKDGQDSWIIDERRFADKIRLEEQRLFQG
jgi:hypothetical protein